MLYTAPEFRPPGIRSSRTAVIKIRICIDVVEVVICKCNNVHTGQDHALLQTFLKTTKLASISLSLIYLTMAIRYTTVHSFVLDSSLEKAFASMRKKKSYLGTLIFIILFR